MIKNIILLAFILVLISGCSKEVPYTIMTFNIRYDNEGDGDNKWDNRKEKVVSLIKKYNPDVLGIQEGLKNQVDYLMKNLPEYTFCGVGRDDGKTKGEYSALFYKNDRFEGGECSTFWLSETPEIPSIGWDAALNRIATQSILTDKNSKEKIIVMNTHFDHRGPNARLNSAKLLKEKALSFKNEPSIVMGDFNAAPDSEPYREIVSENILIDAYSLKGTQTGGTFAGGFAIAKRGKERIDHIFVTSKVNVLSHKIIEDNDGEFYPSDHLPILVEFEVNE